MPFVATRYGTRPTEDSGTDEDTKEQSVGFHPQKNECLNNNVRGFESDSLLVCFHSHKRIKLDSAVRMTTQKNRIHKTPYVWSEFSQYEEVWFYSAVSHAKRPWAWFRL